MHIRLFPANQLSEHVSPPTRALPIEYFKMFPYDLIGQAGFEKNGHGCHGALWNIVCG